MPLDGAKLAALKAIKRPTTGEIVAVYWGGEIGTKYYSWTRLHELPSMNGIPVAPVEARFSGFQEFELSADISDETVPLDFIDLDQQIADNFYASGQGVKVEIFYYFPQVDWMPSLWWGLLQPPRDADYERFRADASAGFRSQFLMMPRRGLYPVNCPATFGGTLGTMGEVNANDCRYDRHLGGSRGLLNGGVPFTSCPRRDKNDCIARWGDALSYMGIVTDASPIVSDPGNGVIAASRGNESNLKRPLRVVIGKKHLRDLDLLAWRREPNPSTPDRGFVSGLWAICEGPVNYLVNLVVDGVFVGIQHINYNYGHIRQSPTTYAPGISNFSGTAHVFGRHGWVNANNTDLTRLSTLVLVEGLNNIRVYSDVDTYSEQYTNNRVWGLLECYRNRRWGRGYSISRFDLASWIDTAQWSTELVRFTDSEGTNYDHQRTQLDVDLQGRIAQQHIVEICRSGRIGIPFQYEGKYKIVPLKKEADLDAVPVFTDVGEHPTIYKELGKPIISYSQLGPEKLPNKIILTYEYGEGVGPGQVDIERPLVFENQLAQEAAGAALNDNTTFVVEKRYSAFGIRNFNEAVKLGWSLLDVGEFDSGGLKNNLEVRFRTWFEHALELHKYKVIKIVSSLIERFGFQYFRVKKMRRRRDLYVDVICQAYNENWYETFETSIMSVPEVGYGAAGKKTDNEAFGSVSYDSGYLTVNV